MNPHAFRRLAAWTSLCAFVVLLASPQAPAAARTAAFHRHVVAGKLRYPAAFTFTPSGHIVYGERFTGEIRILRPATHRDTLLFRIPNVVNAPGSEQGLLGIALHPRFPKTPLVYAYATRNVGGRLRDQIVRVEDVNGHGRTMRVIFSSKTTSGSYHDGGRILFGPDGRLYAVQGEAHDSSNAQNLRNAAGKVLRMTGSGAPAPGNPFIHSATRDRRIWSFGLRNSYGFAFDPRTGKLWETENGPECNDELNRIVKGANFGWGPNETCGGASPRDTNNSGPRPRILPKQWYTPTIAPTGAVFCRGCHLGAKSRGRLFFGAFNTGDIRRVTLTANRLRVRSQSVIFHHREGILSMERGPNGRIYLSDSHAIYRLTRR